MRRDRAGAKGVTRNRNRNRTPHSQPGDARAHAHADAALVAQLAARRFDAAVVFTSHAESALSAARLCRLAGIPLRLAHAADPAHDAGDDARHALTDPVPDPESGGAVRHDAMRQIGLIRHLGCSTRNLALSFAPRPDDLEGAHTALLRLGLAPGQPCVLLHPGAGAPAHRYPPALWAAVARGLADATGLPLLFTGSRADVALVDAIRAGCGVATRSLAGELDLGQLGALIRMAALLVCASTGPAQIAAAVGTPLVAPYALTHPQRTPWQVRSRVLLHDVPCRFCHADTCPLGHHACLAHIAPGRIVDAAIDLVSNRPAAPRS